MRIALVNTCLLPGRGSDEVVHHLAIALAARHEVTVFAPFGARLHSDAYRLVAGSDSDRGVRVSWSSWRSLRRMRAQLAQFDIVHCHHALLSLLLPRERLITTYHGYRGRMHFLLGSKIAARLSDFVRFRIISHALRRSCRVTIVSQSLRAEADCSGLAMAPTVIYNGIDVGESAGPMQPSEPGSYFTYVGRVDPDKSVDRLIELYHSTDVNAPLLIVGDGAHRRRLEARWSVDERIRFVGRKPREEVAGLLEGAIAFLTASTYETFCLPVIEAAAAGKPSVGPCSGSLPEIVKHGETGYLYADGAQFQAAILALARVTEQERRRMAQACRAWAARFSWLEMCRSYESLYATVALDHANSSCTRRR